MTEATVRDEQEIANAPDFITVSWLGQEGGHVTPSWATQRGWCEPLVLCVLMWLGRRPAIA
jgi:hypothetical protein